MTALSAELEAALTDLAQVLAATRDQWWLIGSVAVLLHGADPGRIADIDVILSELDARSLFPDLGLPTRPGPTHHQFASKLFGTWYGSGLPVELMAGLHQNIAGAWHPVMPNSRVEVTGEGWRVFVPDRAELGAILRSFGRPKDLRRLAALDALA